MGLIVQRSVGSPWRGGAGLPALGVWAEGLRHGRCYLEQKYQEVGVVLTVRRIGRGSGAAAPAVWSSGGARAAHCDEVDAAMLRASGSCGSTREDLRWYEGGQGGRSINGGEQLLGDGLTSGGGAVVDSDECRVEAEGRRLGVGPGHGAELLRQLAMAGTSGSTGNTAAQAPTLTPRVRRRC